jgi:cell wall-associated NlpC family hydrolase
MTRGFLVASARLIAAVFTLLLSSSNLRAQTVELQSSDPVVASTTAERAKNAAAMALQGAHDLAVFALGMIGVNYRYGGTNPSSGFDCSGLVQYVFQQVTGVTLPRTARELSRIGSEVALPDLAPGDLVFFNTRRFAFSHVGIYLGDNKFIHAPMPGSRVEVTTMEGKYWQNRFDGARRLVRAVPNLMPILINNANAALADPAIFNVPDAVTSP